MLKQSKIWQHGKQKFDNPIGRQGCHSLSWARSRVSGSQVHVCSNFDSDRNCDEIFLSNIGPRQAKTNKTNTPWLAANRWQLAREWRPPRKGGPKMQPPNWCCIVQNPKFSSALKTTFNQARSKSIFCSGLENASRLSLRPPETVSASNQICTINLNYFVN